MSQFKLPVKFIPILILLLALQACASAVAIGITDTPLPTQETSATPLPSSTPEPTATNTPQPTSTPDPLSLCPQPSQDASLYYSEENGFCFLYPTYFNLQSDSERPDEAIWLLGPLVAPGSQESLRVFLILANNGPSEELGSAGYASRWQELYQGSVSQAGEETRIGGQAAVILNDLPSFSPEQSAFIVANGFKYRITLSPQEADVPELAEHIRLVWETVTNSIVFFPPNNQRIYRSASEVCPSNTSETRMYTRLIDGYCLLYPVEFESAADFPGQFTGGPVLFNDPDFGDVRPSLTVGTFGSFQGQTPLEIIQPRMEFIDQTSVKEAAIGEQPAVTFIDPRRPWASRQALVMYKSSAYTILEQPWEPDSYPEGLLYLENIWNTVTASIRFFDKWR
jgi:hypothetical protein